MIAWKKTFFFNPFSPNLVCEPKLLFVSPNITYSLRAAKGHKRSSIVPNDVAPLFTTSIVQTQLSMWFEGFGRL